MTKSIKICNKIESPEDDNFINKEVGSDELLDLKAGLYAT